MRNYLRDLQATHEPKELLSLLMAVFSVIMVIRRLVNTNRRVRDYRLNAKVEISP